MELILMRHGRAQERDEFAATGEVDELRPLTTEGRRRLRSALPGLIEAMPPIALVASSPLLRARQTAEIVLEEIDAPLQELAALAPGAEHGEVNRWLRRQRSNSVLLVGHEPDLGSLASWYLTGRGESFIALKKGAICLLHFAGKPAPGEAVLQLILNPAQLRRLSPRHGCQSAE